MRSFVCIACIVVSIFSSCKKDENVVDTPIDPRDKFVGTWEGKYYIEIPNIPANSPLENLPDSVPTTVVITKSQTNVGEIQLAISNTLLGNRNAVAFVNGNRYYYEPFTTKFFNLVDVSLKGDGLLSADLLSIAEVGFLNTTAVLIPPQGPFPGVDIPALVGIWSSKLKKKM
ncbi:MAG: hypothetical protein ACK5BV_01305 [Bacteroidota bacterium]